MFRQAIFYLALFMFGMISSHDLLVPSMKKAENFNIEINGNLSITSVINTNNEISHQQIDLEHLKFATDVKGQIHYTIGARTSSEYGIFFLANFSSIEKGGELMFSFFLIHLVKICHKVCLCACACCVPVERMLIFI